MSTKRMRKTLLEPGNRSNPEQRSFTRAERRAANVNIAMGGDGDVDRRRKVWGKWGKETRDNTNSLRRFLKSHVGQKWDDVYSELCHENDQRSIDGFHLRSRIRDYVHNFGPSSYRYAHEYHDFVIDENGILAANPRKRIWRGHRREDKNVCASLESWLNGWLIRIEGNEMFWMQPVFSTHIEVDGDLTTNHSGYRQAEPVDAKRRAIIEGFRSKVPNFFESRCVWTPAMKTGRFRSW